MAFLFQTPKVTIDAPPPPPPAPGMTDQERQLLDLERQLGLINLQIQQEQQNQDQAVRTALEKQFGAPLSDVLAKQIAEQSTLFSGIQSQQTAALEAAKQERAAIARLTGMTPEELTARQIADQFELGALTRTTQRNILDQAERERQAYIAATGMTPEVAQAQEAQRQRVLSEGLFTRFQAGLAGTLPVSPGLERSLMEQRATLEASLRQALGPGYAQSTPGIQSLAEFDKRANELRESARTGAITEAEQVGFAGMPATERVRLARQSAVGSGTGPLSEALLANLTGQGAFALPNQSPIATLNPFMQRSFLQTPPQLASVRGALTGERAFQFAPQLQGYQNAVNFTNALNQARIGATGARSQAQGGVLGALIGAGGTAGAAYLGSGSRNYYYPWGAGQFNSAP